MNIEFSNYKKKFDTDGFFVLKKFLTEELIFEIIDEINKAQDTIKYYDESKILRRIEKIYNKGRNLMDLNLRISTLLKNIFGKEFLIFKDKFNAKPPNGEGFFAHYDGIFEFVDNNNIKKKGWYEYGDFFISVLIAIDNCNKENGALELSKFHKGNFDELFKNTKKNGTPALSDEIESKMIFETINLNIGDAIIFSNKCPHRSKKNYSKKTRRILYYTYSLSENGSKYDIYFEDKKNSQNKKKAL